MRPALALLAVFVSGWAVPPRTQLDHIVVAIRSLDEGIAQFAELTGVKAGAGGRHPGRGTENALVSLGGGSYLEIIAPQKDAKLSAEDAKMRGLSRLTVVDWAVRVADVDAAIAALKTSGIGTSRPQPGARLTPSGERLDWMTFGLADAHIDSAPFFIRWSPNTRHPSTTAPGGCGLEGLVVRDPAADRLQAMLNALDVRGVTIEAGAAAIEATIGCGGKRATLTSAPAK
jgi:glyoxalase-like protein